MQIDEDIIRHVSDQELTDALGAQCTDLGKILDEFERRGNRIEIRHELYATPMPMGAHRVENVILYNRIK